MDATLTHVEGAGDAAKDSSEPQAYVGNLLGFDRLENGPLNQRGD
jgi:hypothetical protein